ncbi:hypothetical protein [Demequina maris]|uniref:hypothetical protein n=1 Tax=Demequina maris TaxID=1638982 RepID=UPI00078423A4|nr:hypothetical protein [Demequina maris]
MDDLAELAERSDMVITGHLTAVDVSSPIYATPDPGTPEATYGGQVLTTTVKPSDGGRSIKVEFIYQFAGDQALKDARDVVLPDEEVVLALVPTGDANGKTYRCVADSSWCPLVWNGEGLESASWSSGTLPLHADQPVASFSSLDDVTADMVEGTDAELLG